VVRRGLGLLLIGLLALTACGHSKKHTAAKPTATTAKPSPAGPSVPPGSWFDGIAGAEGPVVAVKVDNAASARPLQLGLDKAQIVYQELVEGGATRFAAVFVGRGSFDIGPVRSGRDTDIGIFAPYGRVILGFASANRGVLSDLQHANLSLVPIQYVEGSYVQRGRRAEAYNFFTSLDRLITHAPKPYTNEKDVGFRFGAAPAGGTVVTGRLLVTFNNDSHDRISWDARHRGWAIDQNPQPVVMSNGSLVRPHNVLIQWVKVHSGKYVDVEGFNSPESDLVGHGQAALLRDGHMYMGSWSRKSKDSITQWMTTTGAPLNLEPGQTWILLIPTGTQLSAG
jgi:DUF3048 family protein